MARANGITHAVAVPGLASAPFGGAGVMGGQASAISLGGWIGRGDVAPSVGRRAVNWPRMSTGAFDLATFSQRQRPFSEMKAEYEKVWRDLGDWIERARRYALARQQAPATTDRDLKLEALVSVIDGRRPLLIAAVDDRQIHEAIDFCTERKLKMVLLGGDDALSKKDELVRKAMPVILGPTQVLPGSENEPYDAPYSRAAQLHGRRRQGLDLDVQRRRFTHAPL